LTSGEKIGGGQKWRQKKLFFCVDHNIFSKQKKIPIFMLKLLFLHLVGNKKGKKEKKLKKFGYVMTIIIITGYTFGAGLTVYFWRPL
jgi:hypothetical protein